ncbi:MAG: thiamine pyrophosphate-requiring protein [Candidatus Tectomicrobia bacterium]|nr:thiamine pyrophosphate-requiring protein [Candidatus Tectomicrobia bacterium]
MTPETAVKPLEQITTKTISVETTAQAYLEILRERGVDYFFGNAGTDFASIVDAFAKFALEGKTAPKPITVPHEFAAVSMAHGYYMMTGRPQVVMTHVIVGAANALGAIINANRSQVPVIFTAGRTPITEDGFPGSRNLNIHWAQESFDQGSMLREFVKWDYELRNFSQLETVVDRAFGIAMAEPRGPVYLTLPREVLAEPQNAIAISHLSRHRLDAAIYPDPEKIEEAARLLAEAENPLIITAAVGKQPLAVQRLVELAESFAIPVVMGSYRNMNFPTEHPLHLGYSSPPYVDQADLILVIDCDVPWIPSLKQPKATTRIIQMGADPAYIRYPIRGFSIDVPIIATSEVGLAMLTQALIPYRSRHQVSIESRFARIKEEHDRQREAWKAAALKAREDQPIDMEWLSYCLNQVKDDNTIFVNEYDIRPTQIELDKPGTFFGSSPASGLGWGLGAALGAKLAAPEKTVIAGLGDGSYMFCVPTSCHFVSRASDLPILVVIFNNQCWNAVKSAARGVHPDGWAVKTNNFPLSELSPTPDFEKIVTAFGGYGEKVERPEEVIPALHRALRAVREEKRQAVLNVICKHP